MQNYKQPGDVLTVAAPYDLASGDGAKVGAIFGVAVSDADYDAGDDAQLKTEGVFSLAKTSAQAWSVGDRIYWNDSTKKCDTDSTAGMFVGVALEAAANPSSTGIVRLMPSGPLLEGAQTLIAALTENSSTLGGTQTGDISALSVAWNGSTNPTAAEGAALIDGIREVAAKLNTLIAELKLAGVIKSA